MSPPTWPLVIAAAVVGAAACVPPLAPPPGAQLSCANTDDCPAGFACATAQQRCVVDGGSCVVGGDVLDDGTSCESAGVLVGVCNVGVCAESSCGDGVVAAGEGCDDGAANSDVDPDACRTDCSLARCGDGVTDGTEVCDTEVGLGGSCDQCERLFCRGDTANCNLDTADGCECAPPIVVDSFENDFAVTTDGRFGLVVTFAGEGTFSLEQVDLETGQRGTLTRFTSPPERPLASVSDQLVVVGQDRFFVVNGAVYRIDEGVLTAIREPQGADDEISALVAHGELLVARTGDSIVRFEVDGSAEVSLTRLAFRSESEARTLAVTRGGDVGFLAGSRMSRVAISGAGPVRVNAREVRSNGASAIFAVEDDLVAWDNDGVTSTLLRFSETDAIALARIDGRQLDEGGNAFAVDGATLFACVDNVFIPGRSHIIALPLDGDPDERLPAARMLAPAGGVCRIAAGRGRLLYREGTRLRLLEVGR